MKSSRGRCDSPRSYRSNMADNAVVTEHRQAASEAQARGDTRSANAEYAAELLALSDARPTQDTSAESLDDTGEDAASPAGDEKTEEPGDDTQFPQYVPVPVEITDRFYNTFREEFSEDDSASLQRHWGNNAFGNEQIVRAVIKNHPQLDRIYVAHQTDNGLSFDGVADMLLYVLEQSGESGESFLKKHPEIENIYNDHADEQGNISITGAYRLLHHIGKKSGYRHTYRGNQR